MLGKNRDIKNGDHYIALDIPMNFGNMENIKITSSEPKDYLEISGKGLINSMGIKTIRSSKKIKKASIAITEVSLKDLSKMIKEFKDLIYEGYARKSSKHMPTASYFYLSRHVAKCMMRNLHVSVRIQNIITQNMSNYKMSTQIFLIRVYVLWARVNQKL